MYILAKSIKSGSGLRNALINIKGYRAIKKNHLFDEDYYLKNNCHIRQSGMDPLLHYIYHGFKEGRNPSPTFDTSYYLKYVNVKNSGLNPLVHYSLYGINENRLTREPETVTKASNLDDEYRFTVIQYTPQHSTNPYYYMHRDGLTSQGVDIKFINNFPGIESVLKVKSNCIIHLHQIEQYYHVDGDEEATIRNAHEFLDNLKRMKTLGAKLVYTMHNPVPHNRRFQKIDEKVNEAMFSLSDHIIVLGRYPKETLIKDQNVTTPISVVIHPRYGDIYPPKMDKIRARKELGLPLDAIIFGNIASIKPYKGHELIVEAFKELLKHRNSDKLVLLFAGVSQSADHPDLQKYIDSLKESCGPDLVIVDRELSESELIQFISALDYSVFAFKDIWASGSVVLSLDRQVPVIVPDIGTMSDYVHHQDNGLIYKHGNLDSLIEAMNFLTQLKYSDYLRMQYMCEVYLEDNTVSHAVAKLIKIYEQVLQN